MRIALVGYGKMGKSIEDEAKARGHIIIAKIDTDNLDALYELNPEVVDVAIEFTQPEAAFDNYKRLIFNNIPVVTGTTGWYDILPDVKQLVEQHKGRFIYASNFSIGVNVLFRLNQQLAQLMSGQPGYRCDMMEAHHIHKKDAPSGTALSLVSDITRNAPRIKSWKLAEASQPAQDSISINSIRKGEIIGTHEVTFTSEIDQISIRHEAFNRRGFALGAVLAAEWLADKQGFYNFSDIFADISAENGNQPEH